MRHVLGRVTAKAPNLEGLGGPMNETELPWVESGGRRWPSAP
jgi:hypothetical protein